MTEIELKVKALTDDWYLVGVAQAQSSPRAVELSETAGNLAKRIMREIILPMQDELAAANATIAQLTDDLTEAAQVADADNATVAALVSRIEDEKVTALRQQVAELTEKLKSEGYNV